MSRRCCSLLRLFDNEEGMSVSILVIRTSLLLLSTDLSASDIDRSQVSTAALREIVRKMNDGDYKAHIFEVFQHGVLEHKVSRLPPIHNCLPICDMSNHQDVPAEAFPPLCQVSFFIPLASHRCTISS